MIVETTEEVVEIVKSKAGRPAQDDSVVVSGVIPSMGTSIAWCSGVFAGDASLVRMAKIYANMHAQVRLHPLSEILVETDSTTVVGATAAILASDSRMVLVDVPDEIIDLLPEDDSVDLPEFTSQLDDVDVPVDIIPADTTFTDIV